MSKPIGLLLLSDIIQHDSFFRTISFSSVCAKAHDASVTLSPDDDFGNKASSACSAWKNELSRRMMSTREQPSCDGGGQLVCRRRSSSMETYGSLWRAFFDLQRGSSRRSTTTSTRYVCRTQNVTSSAQLSSHYPTGKCDKSNHGRWTILRGAFKKFVAWYSKQQNMSMIFCHFST